ncbi:hypothetical protein AMTRI_Chr07g28880 [Amborella trichopoda]|uniref:Uncharacterized protein n=1 Tax=Amborella trichopoda TaxID=13333 RepID=W1PAR4_AMBTC|nr:hypothetical protein AMTR_s00140p00053130 [Amborella trichopoda]
MPLNSQSKNLSLLMPKVEGAESEMVEQSKVTSKFDVMGADFDVPLRIVYNDVMEKKKARKLAEAAKDKAHVKSGNSQKTPVKDLGKSKLKALSSRRGLRPGLL